MSNSIQTQKMIWIVNQYALHPPKPDGDVGITKKATKVYIVKEGSPNRAEFTLSFSGSLPVGETIVVEDVFSPGEIPSFNPFVVQPWSCSISQVVGSASKKLKCELTGLYQIIPDIRFDVFNAQS